MEPLSLTASLIAVAQITISIVDTCYKWKSSVRNASKQTSQIIRQLDSPRTVLERLIEIVENEGTGSSRLAAVASLSREDGPFEGCMEGLVALQVQLQPKTGWKAIGNALVWPLKEEETQQVLQGLNDLRATLHFALETDNTVLALQMDSRIKNLTVVAGSIKNDLQPTSFEVFLELLFCVLNSNHQFIDEYRREITEWLAAPNSFANHNAARKSCEPSTGMWFLNSRLFTRWIHGDCSMLWLHGIPGSGKSVLCSTTIERLYSITKQSSFAAIAYFYFDFRNFANNTVEGLVRSLIVQLFNQLSEIPPELELFCNQFKDNNNKPSLSKLMELLSLLVQRFQNTYFAIDALDECEETENLLLAFGEFQNWNLSMLHILVFSRRQRAIDEFMATAGVETLCLDDSRIGDDINWYLKKQLENSKFSKWTEDVRSQIYSVLSDGANGMFRWAACQLDMLGSSLTLKSLKRDLRSLPKSLEETCDRILLRTPERYRPYTFKILSWLSFATRPMSIMEVAEMLALDLEDDPCYDAENVLADPRDVLLMCSSLVLTFTASPEDLSEWMWLDYDEFHLHKSLYNNDETQWLRLTHLSVKDYLLSEHIRSSPTFQSNVDARIANEVMAQTCLAYLLLPVLEDGPCGPSTLKLKVKERSLLSYAAHYWPHHTIASSPLGNTTWTQIKKLFSTRSLPNGGNYAAWIQMLAPGSLKAQQSDPLYYASSFGMYEVVKKMLEENPSMDIEAKGGRYNASALHVAVYRQRNEIAKLLIDAGANVHDKNSMGESMLLWAFLENTSDIQTLLQKHGAELSASDMADSRLLDLGNDLAASDQWDVKPKNVVISSPPLKNEPQDPTYGR